ncbi:MAG: nitrate/nitrite transporter NrtS [Cyanobacteria bacterium P01_D01_bin.105]
MRTLQQIIQQILATIRQPQCRRTAFRVALVVGTVLFTINHGSALLAQEMNQTRWLAAISTYCVPFMVSIHGQSQGRKTLARRRTA